MSGIYLPDELWNIIKLFLFHDIRYGIHLKNDKYIILYNNIIKKLPKRKIPKLGPRVIYNPINTSFRNFKYIYFIKIKNIRYMIIEIQKLPDKYQYNFKKFDKLILNNYYKFLDP
jgi:hypothetical protein